MESSRQRFFHLLSDVAYTEVGGSGPWGGRGLPTGCGRSPKAIVPSLPPPEHPGGRKSDVGGCQGQVLLWPPREQWPRPLLASGGCWPSLPSQLEDTPPHGASVPTTSSLSGGAPHPQLPPTPYRWFRARPKSTTTSPPDAYSKDPCKDPMST